MILHRYFAWRFFTVFCAVFFVFFGLFFLLDMVEQIRKFDSDAVGLLEISRLTLLNVPQGIYRIMPLIMVLATLALFLSLSRSSELVVTRAAGRSAVRFLLAPLLVAFLIGVFATAIFNPIVAGTSKAYERLSNQYSQGSASILSLSGEGLWLRQGGPEGQTVIQALRANLDGTRLFDVTFFGFSREGAPQYRIRGAEAELGPTGWIVMDAKRWDLTGNVNPEQKAVTADVISLKSDLTQDQIRDSFGTPSSIPIWDIPTFIGQLERAGFSARAHRVWLQTELASPLMMVAMMLVGAAFTMRHIRFGRTGLMVLSALGMGFATYFIRNFAQILGESGQIPVWLAAWSPPAAAILFSLGLILNLEDG